MAKRTLSEQAAVAKIIRQELKKNGVPGRVKSKSFAGGDSVSVTLFDPLPATLREVDEFCGKYQYGHFNGMEDIYEYSNSRGDIPQTKYLMVTSEYSDELKQAAWDWLRENYSGFDESPESAQDAYQFNHSGWGEWGSTLIHRVLHDSLNALEPCGFWSSLKKRIAA